MTLSTTFQSKISKTKKRLSNQQYVLALCPFAVMTLFAIMPYALRSVAVPGTYSTVSVEIPVVSVPIEDPAFHRFKETSQDVIRKTTTAVILTTDSFYFSDLESFTSKAGDRHDKYFVRHVDGEPQLLTLLTSIQKWQESRRDKFGVLKDDILVFLPHGDIPMPIVTQTLAGFHQSGMFKRVILGGGLL